MSWPSLESPLDNYSFTQTHCDSAGYPIRAKPRRRDSEVASHPNVPFHTRHSEVGVSIRTIVYEQSGQDARSALAGDGMRFAVRRGAGKAVAMVGDPSIDGLLYLPNPRHAIDQERQPGTECG